MRFTTDNKRIIKCMWVKKIRKETLAQDVFDRLWGLDGYKDWSKHQCEIFNFVDLCSGVGVVWSTTTQTRVSNATAVTFSIKCFNPLKLNPLSGNIIWQWFVSYFLFIHEHLIIIWSPTVNLIAVMTFSDVPFTLLLSKNI